MATTYTVKRGDTLSAITGDDLTLYWVHNSEDGSSQTYAELELTIDGTTEVKTIKNSTEESEKDKVSAYPIDTIKFPEGTKILWRVRTKGITDEYGDWSVQRTVDIYAPPTLEMHITEMVAKFPRRSKLLLELLKLKGGCKTWRLPTQ